MTSLADLQNEPRALDLLAASRHIWSAAKMRLAIAIGLSVPAVIAWSIVGSIYPSLKPYAALWGLLVFLSNIIIERRRRRLSRKAAAVQELYDCELFELEWNPVCVGPTPVAEEVAEATERYKARHPNLEALRDWYPKVVAPLPLPLARLICQRANCTWEAGLRQKYVGILFAVLGLLIGAVSIAGLVGGFTVGTFLLSVVVPLMPAVSLTVTQFYEHRDAGESSDRLARHAEDLLDRAMKGGIASEDLERASRRLQDAIYDRRRSAPPVFDWIYRRLRSSHDARMAKAADDLVQRALAAIKAREHSPS